MYLWSNLRDVAIAIAGERRERQREHWQWLHDNWIS